MNVFGRTYLTLSMIACTLHGILELSRHVVAYEVVTNRIQWVPSSDVDVSHLIPAGKQNDKNYYIARTKYLGGVLPGKVYDNEKQIFFGFNGKELKKDDYELLVYPHGALSWVEVFNGTNNPQKLFRAGTDPRNGKPLYICRAWAENKLVVGKLAQDSNICEVPLGSELASNHYDVLAQNVDVDNNEEKVPCTCSNDSGFGFFIVVTIVIVILGAVGATMYYFKSWQALSTWYKRFRNPVSSAV